MLITIIITIITGGAIMSGREDEISSREAVSRRLLFVFVVVLLGLVGTARAEHFLTHPAAPYDAKALFENEVEIKVKHDPKVYIAPQYIPENDWILKAYSADKAERAKPNRIVVPGLRGISSQAYRARHGAGRNRTYSLADAMRDAIWRRNTAAKLETLLSARSSSCADAGQESASAAPSIGLGITC